MEQNMITIRNLSKEFKGDYSHVKLCGNQVIMYLSLIHISEPTRPY